MARPLRIEYPGALYHITSRGNARQDIFIDDADRQMFLSVFADVVDRYNWIVHAYCLMDNHYHLLVETPDPNLSLGMRQLNGQYTQSFNRRHNRVGHIFQGRYKSIIVEKNTHLLALCRYVVLNPVAAGMVNKPEQWKWSSYSATATAKKSDTFLTTDWLLLQFSSKAVKARKVYRQFVVDGMSTKDIPWKSLQGQIFLGGTGFVAKMLALIEDRQEIQEIPRKQRYPSRPKFEELMLNTENKDERNKHIITAHVTYGYTLKEIAEHLNIHYTTVSKVVNKGRKK